MTSDDAVNPNDVPAPPTGEKPAAREEKSPEDNSPDEKSARVRPVKPLKHQQGGGVVPKKAAEDDARTWGDSESDNDHDAWLKEQKPPHWG